MLHNAGDAEIILINDGSKDQSGRICEEYKEKYPNIVYIDKPNGGVSAARNDGLDAASGKYVLFVDSDDYVVEDFYQILDSVTENEDFDASILGGMDCMLKIHYGDYMQLPPEEDRVCKHQPLELSFKDEN